MQTQRILNIVLAGLLALLLAQTFFGQKPAAPAVQTPIALVANSKSHTVPDVPELRLENKTASGFAFDTCADLAITRDGVAITGLPKAFCAQVSAASGTGAKIDLDPLAALFEHAGTYTFTLKKDATNVGTSVMMEEPGAFRSFFRTILYAPIYNLFVALIALLPNHSLGLAIVIVTILIRIILLAPQHHMLQNSKKMQAIQPKLKAIQEKHKDDQAALGQAMLALYKEEGVNPLGSCLPLLVQMPILIMLYSVVLHIGSVSNTYFLYPFVEKLGVGAVNTEFFGLMLDKTGGVSAIALAVIVGALQWVQIWLSLPPKPADVTILKKNEKKEDAPSMMPDANEMGRMMLWGLPPVIAFSVYAFPLGVGLYWFVNTAFMIGQQWVVNRAK